MSDQDQVPRRPSPWDAQSGPIRRRDGSPVDPGEDDTIDSNEPPTIFGAQGDFPVFDLQAGYNPFADDFPDHETTTTEHHDQHGAPDDYRPVQEESSKDIDVYAELFDDSMDTPQSEAPWAVQGGHILGQDGPSFVVDQDTSASAQFRSDPHQPDALYTTDAENDWMAAADEVVRRYLNQDDFYLTVTEILSLANSSEIEFHNVINTFVLTRDKERDALQRQQYEELLAEFMPKHGIQIPNPSAQRPIIDMAYDELLGIGPLGPLWRDDEVTDILVNGPNHVTVERSGRLVRTPVRFRDLDHLQSTARRLSTLVDDRAVTRNNAIVTVQLPSARVQLVWEPIAVEGCSIVIRKHRGQLELSHLINAGALTQEMVAFLADAVYSQATILVSGATGSGKTTYLNVLSGFIPAEERVLVIEDARELHLKNEEVEYMLTKGKATSDDVVIYGFDRLLEAALRMRPDRIVVGEILSPAGAAAMLEAAFTGHDGTMTTLHANNPTDALVRIAGLLRHATGAPDDLARQQVNGTFDLVVQVRRDKLSGVRLVTHIAAVLPDGNTVDVFRGRVTPDHSTEFTRPNPLGADTALAQRMQAAGIDTSAWEAA